MYPSNHNKKQTYTQYYYQIHNQQIQQNKLAKYLGVVINGHLTWKDHINDICSRAIKAKAFLQRNLHRFMELFTWIIS